MRALASHLETLYRVDDLAQLVQNNKYDLGHELVGALDVIASIREIADELEAHSRGDLVELEG